jgi:uncharacterized protein YecE (DUF72 family)
MPGEIRIGISGWTYAPWRKVFYPEGLVHRRELEYASRAVNSIEINGTFYALQKPESYRKWFEETPDDFVFSVKGNRFLTHIKRLRDVEGPLSNFLASGVLALEEKLGPILWQLPPNFRYDREVIESFLRTLPHTTMEAARLAKRHDDTVKGRALLHVEKERPMRHALEVRHASFENPGFIELLRKYEVALVVADTAGKWPFMEDLTADFVYVRLHGDEELYASGYSPSALKRWASKVKSWSEGSAASDSALHAESLKPRKQGRDVFVYFDNDIKTHAPFDARALAKRLGVQTPEPKAADWVK